LPPIDSATAENPDSAAAAHARGESAAGNAPNLGLYLQVPFCASKCSFCNFSSRVAPHSALDEYTRALIAEVRQLATGTGGKPWHSNLPNWPVDTVYFGGGTPTLLGAARFSQIVAQVHPSFRWAGEPEFTVEVTPGSADRQWLHQARRLGVNRLSIGAQTFEDNELSAVGRLHRGEDIAHQVEEARRQGLVNISLDLIAGLPHQTFSSWRRSLQALAWLRPEHVSVYLFEVDEKSRLGAEVLRHGRHYHADQVPKDDAAADWYEFAQDFLQREGYRQYELSNFALPGFESVHNRKYWRRKPYLGLGAGAHSFDGHCRWWNLEQVQTYQQALERGASPVEAVHPVTLTEAIEEFFFLGLRQTDGVELSEARLLWGQAAISPWLSRLQQLQSDGWLSVDGDGVRLNPASYLISNEIFQQLLGDETEADHVNGPFEAVAGAALPLQPPEAGQAVPIRHVEI
jgi:oxygen-independent coproporphyrinogen-3 oxidase